MSEEKPASESPPSPSRCSVALAVAMISVFACPLMFLILLLVYAAWVLHWAIGVGTAVVLVLIALPEGTAEKYGDHTQW